MVLCEIAAVFSIRETFLAKRKPHQVLELKPTGYVWSKVLHGRGIGSHLWKFILRNEEDLKDGLLC